MVDFHTHVLPGMDDGAKDETVSLNMINELMKQGVSTIVCTSHFYPDGETIQDFISRREESINRLKAACESLKDLKLVLGAEVYCHEMLEFINDFRDLCIGNTSVILLELPFKDTLSKRVMNIINRLNTKYSLTVLIAHAERYPAIALMPVRRVKKLQKLGCLIQINASSIIDEKLYKKIKKLISRNMVDIIGSDCHNMEKRSPHLKEAFEKIQKDFGEETVKRLKNNAQNLLSKSFVVKGMREDRLFF